MTQTVHVFISTTKGLVAFQNIVDLKDASLQSVITINGSPDMASISQAYHRFVQKNTGVIQNQFTGASYRANISANIDQGTSWQLPVYAAHWLQHHASEGCFKLGNGIVKEGDIALCLTGQVNTSSNAIEPVEAIAEKFKSASTQIKLWLNKGIFVEFYYPNGNQLAHLPELPCKITPCANLDELTDSLTHLLPNINAQPEKIERMTSAPVYNAEHVIEGDYKASSIATETYQSHRRKYLIIASVILCMMLFALLLSRFFLPTSSIDIIDVKLSYDITKPFADKCDASAQTVKTDLKQQFVIQMRPQRMDDLCSMSLVSDQTLPQVWMVADNKTLMELSASSLEKGQRWHINLPRFQQRNRNFILIISSQKLDLSDLASLNDFLSRLPNDEAPSIANLSAFFSTINVNPRYLTQQLLVN